MPSFRTCAFIDPIKPKYAIILSPRQILPSIGGLLITCERVGQVCFVRTLLTNYRTCQAFNLALELLKPRPPFRADEKYPRGSFPRGGFPGAAFGAHDRSLVGRSIGGRLPVSCPVDGLVSDTALLIAVDPIGLFGVSVRPRQACPYS